MNILVTGGAGFIGSHTIIELYKAGHTAVVVDNLSNSNPESLRRVSKILGGVEIPFHKVDIRDRKGLDKVLEQYKFDACIHFAGLKAVGESVSKPIEYYENNISGTLVLVQAMRDHGVKNIIFSSSATVYGNPEIIPITEECPKGVCTNPYGWTKSMLEQVLTDMQFADKEWNVVLLRYFNPIGAHPSALIGELPRGVPNNLVPYITQTAIGKRECLNIFGNDYPTPDGTCQRDFIDIVDLAKAHVYAVTRMVEGKMKQDCEVFNVGTGRPLSVMELVNAFEKVNGVKLNYKFAPRRAGDITAIWADPTLAETEMGWKATRTIEETLKAAWAWECHLAGK